jgi:hypothetical protein
MKLSCALFRFSSQPKRDNASRIREDSRVEDPELPDKLANSKFEGRIKSTLIPIAHDKTSELFVWAD